MSTSNSTSPVTVSTVSPSLIAMSGFRPPEPLLLSGNLADNFKKFMQRFDVYMLATGYGAATSEKKVAMFLNLIGDEAHDIFLTFGLEEDNANDLSKVIEAFELYCCPRKNIVYDRFVFYHRNREQGEPFDHFLTVIKKLIKTCEFSDPDSMLRDRIVIGINDEALQERLLRVPDLTLQKAMEFCQAAEISHRQAKVLQGEVKIDSSLSINKIKKRQFVKKNSELKIDSPKNVEVFKCKKCGRTHSKLQCPAFGKNCNLCKKPNHFAVGCFKNKNNMSASSKNWVRKAGAVVTEDVDDIESFIIHTMSNANKIKNNYWFEYLKICDIDIKFKLDTGAEANILPYRMFANMNKNYNYSVKHVPVKLILYGGATIKHKGVVVLDCITKNGSEAKIEFTLADVCDTPILGQDACEQLNFVKRIRKVEKTVSKIYSSVTDFINKNQDVFSGIGCFPNKQKIVIASDAIPTVKPAYRVAESLKHRLKETLERYECSGFIEKINEPTDWVHNLTIVEKVDGTLRLCLDPKEINLVIKREHFQIPSMDELTPGLANKNFYTVLDLKDGFFQLELDDESSRLCTFHTPFGRFRFKRMPFGLSSAPEIFHKIMSQTFGDIAGVVLYFDDIIISANTLEEHDEILSRLVKRAKDFNIKFNSKKVQFRVNKVKYLGQVFSREGISPDKESVQAILDLDEPTNKAELQGLLGMVNFLGKFIPNLSTLLAPLHNLLKKKVVWTWDKIHSDTVTSLKKHLMQAPTLKCFDPSKDLIIQTDSSKDGLGSCLLIDGCPLSYASRSLTQAEKNYAQIEKELLSICFATKKFHTFVYGKKVIVHTDHKPLEAIVKKDMSKISARLQRMCLSLLKYNLEIVYRPGKMMYAADYLSRNFKVRPNKVEHFLLEKVHVVSKVLPIAQDKLVEMQEATANDKILHKLKTYCETGWPTHIKSLCAEARWAWKVREQLSLSQNILLLNDRIIIPEIMKGKMLALIHENHLGIVKCKKKARSAMYWKGMSKDIEDYIGKCKICERFQPSNVREPLIQSPIPQSPFDVVGTDIFAYGGRDYLVLSCYLSKWLEVHELKTKTLLEIIGVLKSIFAVHGIPRIMVSDNMPFASREFGSFSRDWGISQQLSSPRYPRSNGLSERMVGVAKNIMKKNNSAGVDFQLALLDYRNTPLDGLSYSPAQLMMNRTLRTKLPRTLPLLKQSTPDYFNQLLKKKQSQEVYYNQNTKSRKSFNVGDSILVRIGTEWKPAVVSSLCDAPRSYIVKTQSGSVLRRNTFDLRESKNSPPLVKVVDDDSGVLTTQPNSLPSPLMLENIPSAASVPKTTRSGRVIQRPRKYSDFVC